MGLAKHWSAVKRHFILKLKQGKSYRLSSNDDQKCFKMEKCS